MTHLASSDVPSDPSNQKQMSKFQDLYDSFSTNPERSILNSSGVINFPSHAYDWVRCGIGLYGFSNKLSTPLKPVHKLLSTISQIIEVSKGESVGYNRAYVANEKTRVGVIPLGHADCISRSFNKGGYLIINGKKCKIVGNVCMDVIMVNLNETVAKEGDQVVVFDDKNTAEDFADSVGTISYEVLTNLSSRIERKIIS